MLAVGGIAGSYLAGWATDRFFGSRRARLRAAARPVGRLHAGVRSVAHASVPGTIALLVVIGFCIYGPQVLLVGTAPADLARSGTAAAAAGFVNSIGYVGAALGDSSPGYYTEQHWRWEPAIYIWAGWAFASAAAAGLLWRVRPHRRAVRKRSRGQLSMRAIIIGAGRGSRLMPTTADAPKCFAEVGGQRMLDWAVDAFRDNGVDRRSPSSAATRSTRSARRIPQFTFRHNAAGRTTTSWRRCSMPKI